MSRAAVVLLIGALGLSACAHEVAAPDLVGDGPVWSLLSSQGEGEKLALGRPDSDDVVLMLACGDRPGRVEMTVTVPRSGARAGFELGSGGVSRAYAALVGPSEISDSVALSATTRTQDPVLGQFAETGRLTLSYGGRRAALPPDKEGRIRRLLAACDR